MRGTANSTVEDKLDRIWSAAQKALQRREFGRAIQLLKSIISIDKKNASAYNRLAIVYAKQGLLNKSVRTFKKAHRFEPTAASNHNLGLIYYEKEKYDISAKYFEEALRIDSDLAARHVAMAKVQEKLGNESDVLVHLKAALKLEDSKQTRAIYLDALSQYRKGEGLSDEMIEALKFNKIPWVYEALDDHEYATDVAVKLHNNLNDLVHGLANKKLSPRSAQTHELGVIFLHDTKASLELIHKNYSHAALNVARSMYEVYLRVSFALRVKSYRGYAEIERSTLTGKLHANQRLLRQPSLTPDHVQQLIASSRRINSKINSLNRRYSGLQPIPSYRNMAIELDDGQLGRNYELFVALYDKGSDSTHAEKSAIERIVGMSGTKQAGLFVDSHELILNLLKLMVAFGYSFLSLKEISHTTRKSYTAYLEKVEKEIERMFT
jgi:tetratricopeptide (TPR) repeat protein